MNIIQLLVEAAYIDPKVKYCVADTREYKTGERAPARTVQVSATSTDYGEGAHDLIDLKMRNDEVIGVVVGATVRHWQAHPLSRALENEKRMRIRLLLVGAEAPSGE